MQRLLAAKDSTGFIERFKQLQALEALQSAIRSRDFKGSINAPFPKPADAVLAPFLAQLKRELYADYRKGFGYQAQLLPQPPLEEGKYLIRVAGGYLSNSIDPNQGLQIVSELDTIKGIGEKTKEALLKKYKSVKRIREAPSAELEELIGKKKAALVAEGLGMEVR